MTSVTTGERVTDFPALAVAASAKEANVSSWRFVKGMLPGMLGLGRVLLKHPGTIRKMSRDAKEAQQRVLSRNQSRQLPYQIPAYRPEMARPVSHQVYLRPTLGIESDAPEIVAMAHQLGAYQKSAWDFAAAASDFVKKDIWFTFAAPLRGALGTLQAGEGTCLDKTHLFIALCRAAGIPGRIRASQEVFNQGMYDAIKRTDPIIGEWYDATGYFLMHVMSEVFLNGEWRHADFSMDYRFEAALGLPISRLGDEPEGIMFWPVPGSTIVCESLPRALLATSRRITRMASAVFMLMQEKMDTEGIALGEKVIAEAGGVEAYDRKIRQANMKYVIPEVSRKLFRAMQEI